MKQDEFCIIVFDSTHEAIKTQKKLEGHIEVHIIPTPRQISKSCGLSLRFDCKKLDLIQTLICEKEERKNKKIFCFFHQPKDEKPKFKAMEWRG